MWGKKMEIELEYDGRIEKTTKEVLIRYFNISRSILDGLISISKTKNGTFKLGKGTVIIDRKAKRKPKATVHIIVENEVPLDEARKPRTKIVYITEGKEYQGQEFADLIGASKNNLYIKTRKYKSATINGYDVKMKLVPIVQPITLPFIYDGETLYRDVTYRDLASIFSRSEAHMCYAVRNNTLERTTGFKIYKKDPTKEG